MISNCDSFDFFESCIHQVINSFNVARSSRESILLGYDCDRVKRKITIDTHSIELRYMLAAVFESVGFPDFLVSVLDGRIVLIYIGK